MSAECRALIAEECALCPRARLKRVLEVLGIARSVWYAKPVVEPRGSLEIFRRRYNEVRPHWALVPQGGGDVLTPADMYVHGHAVELPKWQGWAKAAKEKLQQLIQGALARSNGAGLGGSGVKVWWGSHGRAVDERMDKVPCILVFIETFIIFLGCAYVGIRDDVHIRTGACG